MSVRKTNGRRQCRNGVPPEVLAGCNWSSPRGGCEEAAGEERLAQPFSARRFRAEAECRRRGVQQARRMERRRMDRDRRRPADRLGIGARKSRRVNAGSPGKASAPAAWPGLVRLGGRPAWAQNGGSPLEMRHDNRIRMTLGQAGRPAADAAG